MWTLLFEPPLFTTGENSVSVLTSANAGSAFFCFLELRVATRLDESRPGVVMRSPADASVVDRAALRARSAHTFGTPFLAVF